MQNLAKFEKFFSCFESLSFKCLNVAQITHYSNADSDSIGLLSKRTKPEKFEDINTSVHKLFLVMRFDFILTQNPLYARMYDGGRTVLRYPG